MLTRSDCEHVSYRISDAPIFDINVGETSDSISTQTMFIDRSDCRNSRVGLATCSNCYNCLQNLKMIRKSYFDANIFFAAGHDHFYRRVLLARAMMLHNSSHAVLEKFEQHMEQMARYINYSNLTTSFQL